MIKISSKFSQVHRIPLIMGVRNLFFEVPLVKGDNLPLLEFSMLTTDELPLDLTDKQVQFSFKRQGATGSNFHKDCEVVSASGGIAVYQFVSGDLVETGTYFGDLYYIDGQNMETSSDAIRMVVRDSNK